jgi:hypothetical protein
MKRWNSIEFEVSVMEKWVTMNRAVVSIDGNQNQEKGEVLKSKNTKLGKAVRKTTRSKEVKAWKVLTVELRSSKRC